MACFDSIIGGRERQAGRSRQKCGQARLPMLCAATTGPVFGPFRFLALAHAVLDA